MIRRIWEVLKSPYPADSSPWADMIYGLACGLFVTLFFLVLEPFGFNLVPAAPRLAIFIGYGVITCLAIIANSRLLPRLAPRFFSEENWNTGKQILFMSWVTLVIGLASFFLTGAIFRRYGLTTRWLRLWPVVLFTFFVAVFPITIIHLLNYARLLRRNAGIVLEANRLLAHPSPPAPAAEKQAPTRLVLAAENGKDTLRLALDDLLFIQAEENYVQVYYKGEKPGRALLRSSLTRMAVRLRPLHPRLFRCHRAFIVNTSQIARVAGNAQGLKLTLKETPAVVPVARRYVEEFRRVIRDL
jgi:hypothetical protein